MMTSVFLLDPSYQKSPSFHVLCVPWKWWILSWDEAKSLRVSGTPLFGPLFSSSQQLASYSFKVSQVFWTAVDGTGQSVSCLYWIFPKYRAKTRFLFGVRAAGLVVTISRVYLISQSYQKITIWGFSDGWRLHTHTVFLCLTLFWSKQGDLRCFALPPTSWGAAAGGISRKNLRPGSSGSMQTNQVLWSKYWEVMDPAVWLYHDRETWLHLSCCTCEMSAGIPAI